MPKVIVQKNVKIPDTISKLTGKQSHTARIETSADPRAALQSIPPANTPVDSLLLAS